MSGKSPELFVFIQSYKSKNLPSTRVLNQKHLLYIATRPGVLCNPECGFGLWGKLPGMTCSENIDDLRIAHQEIGRASQDHTLYRAILSVGEDAAKQYDLYDRETWQKLINSRVSTIRQEMHIKPEDFRWVASMHYKKGHPHTHLLYWDAGKEPREEFIAKERFDLMSERVRIVFSHALMNAEELKYTQREQSKAASSTRLQLAAMLKEANLADALNLDHVRPAELDALGRQLVELARTLPASGRLKYKLLPPAYQEQLNAYLDQVMKITDFSKLEKKYAALSAEVTRLYGNDTESAAEFQRLSHEKLYAVLGNEVLLTLRDYARQLQSEAPPEDIAELQLATRAAARLILSDSPAFAQLLAMLPRWRTPTGVILKDEALKKQIDLVTRELTSDIRIRAKAEGYLRATKPEAADKEAFKERKSAVLREVYRAMHTVVLETARLDLGYNAQEEREMAVMGLLRLFRSGSQGKNQLHAQRDLQREKYRNLSETAKRDLQKKRQQEGGWSAEF